MIKLCEEEILRYMGYPSDYKIDEKQLETVRRIKNEIVSSSKPKTIYKHFEIASADRGIEIKDSDVVLLGNTIRKHLEGAKSCIIMAATLGAEVDRILRRTQIKSVSNGLIADACATAYIEAVCDETEKEINENSAMAWTFLQECVDTYYYDENFNSLYDVLDKSYRNSYDGCLYS